MHTSPGLPQPSLPGGGRRIGALLMALLFLFACAPSSQAEEELRKEMQALKAQVAAMQEKLNQIQTGQQAILDQMKQPAAVAAPVAPPVPAPAAAPVAAPFALPGQPPATATLSVAQLLDSKDRYLGTRVKVMGAVGPVMVHHKSLMLKSSQGMVEVLFGDLPDPKLIQTLTSTPLDKPITVTGVVKLGPARGAASQIQINAEAVEF